LAHVARRLVRDAAEHSRFYTPDARCRNHSAESLKGFRGSTNEKIGQKMDAAKMSPVKLQEDRESRAKRLVWIRAALRFGASVEVSREAHRALFSPARKPLDASCVVLVLPRSP
jgi:hypothetical protein